MSCDDFHLSCSDLNQHIFFCKYHYPDHKIFPSRPQNSLFLLYLDIRSLNKNFFLLREELKIFPNPSEIICISKTWLKADLLKNLSIPDYTFHHSPAIFTNAGGVAMYSISRTNSTLKPFKSTILKTTIVKIFG